MTTHTDNDPDAIIEVDEDGELVCVLYTIDEDMDADANMEALQCIIRDYKRRGGIHKSQRQMPSPLASKKNKKVMPH
jgi:hypothetical protein